MARLGGPVAGAGKPRRRAEQRSRGQRAGSWLTWWVLLMALWVWADDSLLLAELVVGAVAAALAATLLELAQHQAATHLRIKAAWLPQALGLPRQVLADSVVVLGALWGKLVRGSDPPSGFRGLPVGYGGDDSEADTRRALLLGGHSVAPNKYALGLDETRDVMVVHYLVVPPELRPSGTSRKER